jgi:hypothetical protein
MKPREKISGLSSHLANHRVRCRRRIERAGRDLATLSTSIESLVERATEHLQHISCPAGAINDIPLRKD